MSLRKKINIFLAVSLPLAIALFLQFLPLTNTTGYEFSFILTIPLFFSGGLIVFSVMDSRTKLYFSLAILSIPLFISLFSNLIFSPCPLSSDLLFYIVLSVPSFICGLLVGVFIKKKIKRYRVIALIISLIFLLSISLVEFYFRPQIYFYNVVFGYFPGTMYDENISISLQLIIYRVISLIFIYIFVNMASENQKSRRFSDVLVLSAIFVVWIVWVKPLSNFSTSDSEIKSQLSQELVTDHFHIYTDPNMKYDTTSLKNIHEFYFNKVKDELDLNGSEIITSYIFKNRGQKKELFGSENADVAKPWLKQIYLDEASFEGTLKHEIVHILAAEFSEPPFYVANNINPALIEGLAMAVENNYDNSEIDYITALAIQNGYTLNIADLFNGFSFMGNLSSLSYLYSGSFVKYLLKNYGSEKIKILYNTGNFYSVYDKKIAQLEEEFYEYISNKNYMMNSSTAQLYFGRQPLIKKICPRLAARIESDAWRLYREEEFDSALQKFWFVYNYSGTYSSLNGIIITNILKQDYKTALQLVEEKLPSFSNTSYFYHLELRSADLYILNSDSNKAYERIVELKKQNPSIGYYNSAIIRELLLQMGINYYNEYLLAENDEKAQILIKLVDNPELGPSVIPTLVGILRTKKIQNLEFYSSLKNLSINSSREGTYAAFVLADYFFSKNQLTKALKFSNIAIKNNSRDEFNVILSEQNKLIVWSMERESK